MWRDFDDDRFLTALIDTPAYNQVGAGVCAHEVHPGAQDALDVAVAFGPFIAALRDERGLTRHGLAERIGIPSDALAALEHHSGQAVDIDTVRALAAFFGISQTGLAQLAGLQPPTPSLRGVAMTFMRVAGEAPAPLSYAERAALGDLMHAIGG